MERSITHMTLIIASITQDGVVVTADSRQTFVNRSGFPRIASDHAKKLVQLNASTVVATAGNAFFTDAGKIKSIQFYLESFRDSKELAAQNTGLGIATALDSYCRGWLERIIKETITQNVAREKGTNLAFKPIQKDLLHYEYLDAKGQKNNAEWRLSIVNFMVAGRDSDGICYAINVTPFLGVAMHSTSESPRVQWIGQTEVLSKLLTGTDPFVISVATMTLQDAIDFSIVLTRMTESIQKFCDGTAGSQGGIPGVGGPIDVVIIPKLGDLRWLRQKELHV